MRSIQHLAPRIAGAALLHGAALALGFASIACRADDATSSAAPPEAPRPLFAALSPHGFFTQIGLAREVTAITAGAMWNLSGDPLKSSFSAYLEASLSRWQSRGGQPSDSGVLSQVAAIPVIRYRFDEGSSRWFGEAGIGATVTSSLYRSGQKYFSTAFNFGDHVGLGYAFGETRLDELALRAEHFSNAGIKHPNPGQNFVQMRYSHHFE